MRSPNFSGLKGKRAEREAISLLQPIINKVYDARLIPAPALARNLMQSMKGGYDVVGLEWLALEIKHHETLHLNDWWIQTIKQAQILQTPALLYKRNNVKWRAIVWGLLPAGDLRIKCPVDIDLQSFLCWFEHQTVDKLASSLFPK